MVEKIIQDFISIALELTILFVAISFLVSLLQGVIPYEKLNKYLSGKNTFIGVSAAISFAFITPFCSCSTIPVIVNLLNKKVRFGVVMVFLFASPVLDPTIITLMATLLGVKVAIIYTLVTSALSIFIGLTLEKLGFETAVKKVTMTGFNEKSVKFSFRGALRETLSLMKNVYPYLLLGAGIGSVIHGAVPTEWITTYLGADMWWLVPVAAIIGIPLYIRISTMIPLSQILIAKGMAFPPVMALMIGSTGASLPEVALLNSIFQKRLVSAFVVSVVLMASISGFLFYLI
ncbi:permease [Bacillus sp. DTU_2020_1000418_1_SI_GHA_SEK_038]|uniref:permease n=1 Tax=Bacillus sp. DTU_2020_1000418_1_SI_GHA_SEK_038 TaxID=3077585 RepID=UPI0028EEF1E3|nr:permease [Bacillus sp. DTU_2020_1000418_1_SI_GHA_SEK_038]WNS75713.1 permease [Bacillus sp. DTU_2020_1000418_1_SI_GHA_SEK_038]